MKNGPDSHESKGKSKKRAAAIRIEPSSSSPIQEPTLSPDFLLLGDELSHIDPGIQEFHSQNSEGYREVVTAYDCRVFDEDPPERRNNFLDLKKVIDVSKGDKCNGLYTTNLAECTFLGFVQLDKNNHPERISGFHFGGGLFKSDLRDSSIVLRKLLENFDRSKPLCIIVADGMSWGHLEGIHVAGPTLAETGERSIALKELVKKYGFNNFNVLRTRARSVLISFKEIPELIHENTRKMR